MTAERIFPRSFAEDIVSLVSRDRSGRGVSKLSSPDILSRAATRFARLDSVAIVSGFFVPDANAPETDGPCGAAVIARAFLREGRSSELWTDKLCLNAMRAAAAAADYPVELVKASQCELSGSGVSGIIFTERLGRAKDGRYYNCRKRDVTRWTEPLDGLAIEARRLGIPTLGIGDGGNEVGMGSFYGELSQLLPDYAECLCDVGADYSFAADVSDWGAYAFTAALSYLWGSWRGALAGETRKMLAALVSVGAVDGIGMEPRNSIDGFDADAQEELAASLQTLWNKYNLSIPSAR